MTDIVERFDFSLFERATNVMATWIMRFRVDDDQWDEVSENDRLTAGHLAGALSAQGLLADPDALSSRDREIERLRAALTKIKKAVEAGALVPLDGYCDDIACLRLIDAALSNEQKGDQG